MKLAFCLFKYFPFGGLQRDFLRIAEECLRRGHTVHVYTMAWQGEHLPGLHIHTIPVNKLNNHRRCWTFSDKLIKLLKKENYDLVVGFNKMQGLDVLYAADSCYVAKVQAQHNYWYQLTPRYRTYAKLEQAIFDLASTTEILLIAEREQALFQHYYRTQAERFHLLPPGIASDRRAPANAAQIRTDLRKDLKIPAHHKLILMVGSGFKTKGVDRAIAALAALPVAERAITHLYIIGQDNPGNFIKQAKQLNIEDQVRFLGGRNDVPRFLLGADLLLHPAYYENTGTVLLEALVAGLPVLTTDSCGYAYHIERAGAGIVIPSPFLQAELNQQLQWMLTATAQVNWWENALAYAANTDLYSLPQRAVDLLEQLQQAKKNTGLRIASQINSQQVIHAEVLFKPAIIGQEAAVNEVSLCTPNVQSTVARPERETAGIVPKVHNDTLPIIEQIVNKYLRINKGFTENTELVWFKSCLELVPDLKKFWQSEDIFANIFKQDGQVYRTQKNRKTLLFATANKSYFLKLHQGVGWRELSKNILQLRLPVLGAHPEWRAIIQLNELGINTARLAGFGSRGINPARVQSFVVMEELHNTISLEDFCRSWPKQPPKPRLKWTLIKEVARIARVLHGNNRCHRDFYLCHFLLDITNGIDNLNPNFIRLFLLDLHRVRQAKYLLAKRWIIKDLAGLYFSSLEIGLKKRDLFRFIKYYRQQKLAACLPKEKIFWQTLIWRAYKLYSKEKAAVLARTNFRLPINFVLEDGKLLMVEQLLRIVPQKRWVLLAQWPHQQTVAKVFKNWQHAKSELVGYQTLTAANITTPPLLFHGWLAGEKLYALLFAYIYPAQNYANLFVTAKANFEPHLLALIKVVAQLHHAGLQQMDLHLKNFLLSEHTTYVLDLASIKSTADKQPLRKPASLKNLGLLLAQLPLAYDQAINKFYSIYTRERDIAFTITELNRLNRWVKYWRQHRLQKYQTKVMRTTTELICCKDWWNFAIFKREYDSKALQVFFRNPDAILASPFTKILKAGNTCTVGLISMEGKQFVVKRYNIKNFWHGLKRAITPSRAAKSWRNAHMLQLAEMPTAKPVAMLERRCGPLRQTAYFISEYVPGIKVNNYLDHKFDQAVVRSIASSIKQLLQDLAEIRVSHGDLKATNILLLNDKPVLIDLDAMRLHRYRWLARRAVKRDWKRLLKNWEGRPRILQIFSEE